MRATIGRGCVSSRLRMSTPILFPQALGRRVDGSLNCAFPNCAREHRPRQVRASFPTGYKYESVLCTRFRPDFSLLEHPIRATPRWGGGLRGGLFRRKCSPFPLTAPCLFDRRSRGKPWVKGCMQERFFSLSLSGRRRSKALLGRRGGRERGGVLIARRESRLFRGAEILERRQGEERALH